MSIPNPLHASIPYQSDSSDLFALIADQEWAIYLDSGSNQGRQGRFDIFASEPYQTLVSSKGETVHTARSGSKTYNDNPFSILNKVLPRVKGKPVLAPFNGGAMGYFSYDLGRYLEKIPTRAEIEDDIPDMAIGIYDWAVVVDHHAQKSWITSAGLDPATHDHWRELVTIFRGMKPPPSALPFEAKGALASNLTPRQYAKAFDAIQRYIHEGDCYQVNLAQRFSIQALGSPWQAYRQLRQISNAPFGAYLNFPEWQVLCNSPERFLKVCDGAVESKPIKGTLPRLDDPDCDAAQRERLRQSSKDRAENLMIVDLIRNDLSKSCSHGSVKVPKLFDVESFASVHHLVSTVQGRLRSDRTTVDLLQDCFPGGSITGAPKLRAMEIIETLEPHRRGAYCGAIGYLGYDGSMDTNISIRTMTHHQGQLRFWAGGGIVADSKVESEYQETLDKVAAMMELLNR